MRAGWNVAWCCLASACGFSVDAGVPGEAGVVDGVVDPDADAASPDGPLVPSGLIAWYRMEDLAVIEDSSGHGHTGSCVSCPDLVAGRVGSGFSFNGTNDHIDVPSATELNTTTAFTVAFWVRFDLLPGSGYSCPVNKYFGSANSNSWQLCYQQSGNVWFFGSQSTSFQTLTRAPPPQANTWYHAAITWDGTTKRIWLNGVTDASQALGSISFDTMPITMGSDFTNSQYSDPFDGILDEVRIYNRLLTSEELVLLAT